MGFGGKRRRGDSQPKSPEFDFLTTLFNLPNRLTLERDDRRRELARRQAQEREIVVTCDSDDDEECLDVEEEEDGDDDDDDNEEQVQEESSESSESESQYETESDEESESEEGSDEADEESEDNRESVSVHRVIVKRLPPSQWKRSASPRQRPPKVFAREHKEAKPKRPKKVKPPPIRVTEVPVPKKVRSKRSVVKSPPASPPRAKRSLWGFKKSPKESPEKSPVKKRVKEAVRKPAKEPTRSHAGPFAGPNQRGFMPEPVFGFVPPAVPQGPLPFQYQAAPHGYNQQPHYGFNQQPASSYGYAPHGAPQMPAYTPFPVFSQQPDTPLQSQFVNGPVNLGSPFTPQSGQSGQSSGQSSGQPGPKVMALEVQKIQFQIDAVVSQLSMRPYDKDLKARKKLLQSQLNSALNKATAPQFQRETARAFARTREPPQDRVTEIVELASDDDEQTQTKLKTKIKTKRAASSLPGRRSARTRETEATPPSKRPASPEREKPLHRCWNCGFVRSTWYHARYPFGKSKRAKSLCESCRIDLFQRGVVGDRHYCSGCGRARSDKFHRQHPAKAGDPHLLNWCLVCEEDTDTDLGTEYVTSESWLSKNETKASKRTNDDIPRRATEEKEGTKSPLPTQALPSSSSSSSRSHAHSHSDHAKHEESIKSSSSRRSDTSSRISVANGSVKEAASVTNAFDTSKNPYKEDSSRNRAKSVPQEAQRATRATHATRAAHSSSASTSTVTDKSKYKQPYVEDSSSSLRVNAAKPSVSKPSVSRSSRRRQVDGATETCGSADGDAPKESGSHRDSLPSTPPPRVLSEAGGIASRTPNHPHPPSSGSSSNKSVSFNPSVGVRQPSRRATSETSSDSDVEDTAIKPDDNSQPSRAGIYGESPTRDKFGRPVSASEHSMPSRGQEGSGPGWGSRTSPQQWDFGRGSFNWTDLHENDMRARFSQEPEYEWPQETYGGTSNNSGNDNWKNFDDDDDEDDEEPTAGGRGSQESLPGSQAAHGESHDISRQSTPTQETAEAFDAASNHQEGFGRQEANRGDQNTFHAWHAEPVRTPTTESVFTSFEDLSFNSPSPAQGVANNGDGGSGHHSSNHGRWSSWSSDFQSETRQSQRSTTPQFKTMDEYYEFWFHHDPSDEHDPNGEDEEKEKEEEEEQEGSVIAEPIIEEADSIKSAPPPRPTLLLEYHPIVPSGTDEASQSSNVAPNDETGPAAQGSTEW